MELHSSGIFFLALEVFALASVWPPVLLPIHAMIEVGDMKKGQKWLIVLYCCLNPESK